MSPRRCGCDDLLHSNRPQSPQDDALTRIRFTVEYIHLDVFCTFFCLVHHYIYVTVLCRSKLRPIIPCNGNNFDACGDTGNHMYYHQESNVKFVFFSSI